MLWRIDFTGSAKEDLQFFRKNDKNLYVKCFDIFQDILKNPEEGIGKPEKLKYFEGNLYSRRINQEHRCVYEIDRKEQVITFYNFRRHYDF